MSAVWYQPEYHRHFEAPPVIETAIALEFPSIPQLNLYQLMKLQAAWEVDYPDISDVPGAPPSQIGANHQQLVLVQQPPPARVWAANPENGLLIQTQSDRLILNWRRTTPDISYPGYLPTLRAEYFRLWDILTRHTQSFGITPIPYFAEFTYVNVVALDTAESPEDVLTVLRRPNAALPGVERQTRFEFVRSLTASDSDPFTGQVRVVGETQEVESKRQLAFTVTAQVLLDSGSSDPGSAIDAAHGLSSYTFSSVVTDIKQEAWGRLPT